MPGTWQIRHSSWRRELRGVTLDLRMDPQSLTLVRDGEVLQTPWDHSTLKSWHVGRYLYVALRDTPWGHLTLRSRLDRLPEGMATIILNKTTRPRFTPSRGHLIAVVVSALVTAGVVVAVQHRGAPDFMRNAVPAVSGFPSSLQPVTGTSLNSLFGTPYTIDSPQLANVTGSPTSRRLVARYEECSGISHRRDRAYGAAAVNPAYEISTPVFRATRAPFLIGLTTQWYRDERDVMRDYRQYSAKGVATCMAEFDARLITFDNSLKDSTARYEPVSLSLGATLPHYVVSGAVKVKWPLKGSRVTYVFTMANIIVFHGHYESTFIAQYAGNSNLTTLLNETVLAGTSPLFGAVSLNA